MPLRNPDTIPIELGPDKVNIRQPYGNRFSGPRRFELSSDYVLDTATTYHEPAHVPENLYEDSDYDLTISDKARMNSYPDWTDDPVKIYQGHPPTQKRFLAHEHASARLKREKPFLAAALQARQEIDSLIVTTPLSDRSGLVGATQATILLKEENLQRQNTFKTRGAALAVKMIKISRLASDSNPTIYAASAGNHAQGVALAAQELDMECVVFMAETAIPVKIEQVRSLGARVVLVGRSYDEAKQACLKAVSEDKLAVEIPAYNDNTVMTGQSTLMAEILGQTRSVDGLWTAVGGGGLIAKNAAVLKEYNPGAKVVGVVYEDNDSLQQSLAAGRVTSIDRPNNWCDGTAVRAPGLLPFTYIQKYVDRVVSVSRIQAEQATVDYFVETGQILEPAAAIVLAALKANAKTLKGTHVGVLGGGNASAEIVRNLKQSVCSSNQSNRAMATLVAS